MARYCVNTNAQETGEHEVHNLDANCDHLPDSSNQRYLGDCKNCHEAVKKAQDIYEEVDGCYYCSNECHTR